MKSLLEVSDLTISFQGNAVVRGISFSIAAGEKLALVGESGSGKTVTALSLLRLLPDAAISGQVMFSGSSEHAGPVDLLSLPVNQMRTLRGQDISMIFQEPMTALNPLMTVGAQIAEVLQLKRGMAHIESTKLAIDLIANTGIADAARRANSYPHQLSGGQRQRAMIAMALACQPKLLLADEPTTALDVTVRGQILDLISSQQHANGMAVLMITHDLNLVRRFANRVAIMENGLIVEQGPVQDVFANPQHPYTRKLMDSKPVRDVVETVASVGAQFSAGPPQAELAPSSGSAVREATSVGAILRARDLRVSYPVPIPGFRGWFRQGAFVAVKAATFNLLPGCRCARPRPRARWQTDSRRTSHAPRRGPDPRHRGNPVHDSQQKRFV